eukprot:m51a1_g7541 hypothetical protein (742) ;mRNA; f:66841-69503
MQRAPVIGAVRNSVRAPVSQQQTRSCTPPPPPAPSSPAPPSPSASAALLPSSPRAIRPPPCAAPLSPLGQSPKGMLLAQAGATAPLKTTNAVQNLRDQQVSSASKESVELALLELLALNNLTVDSIMQGEPELFPILYQFKEHFAHLSRQQQQQQTQGQQQGQTQQGQQPQAGQQGAEAAVLTLLLPRPEFAVERKSFRVDNRLSPAQLLALACEKLGAATPPQAWALYTGKGFRLHSDEPLLSYGFGLLFKSWELHVRKPSDDAKAAQELLTGLMPGAPGRILCEGEALTLLFPPLINQVGLHKKVLRLSSADLRVPLSALMAQVCERIGLQGPDRFRFATVDGAPPLALAPELSLAHYGLGWRFHRWELKVVFAALVQVGLSTKESMREFPWLDVQSANPTLADALVVIRSMEKRLSESEDARKSLAEKSARAHNRIRELKEGIAQICGDQETVTELKQRIMELQQELAEVYDREREVAEMFASYEHEAQQQIASSGVRLSELTRKLEELREEHGAALAHIAELESRLSGVDDKDKQSSTLAFKLQAVTRQAVELKHEVEKLRAEREASPAVQASAEVSALKRQLEESEHGHAFESDALMALIEEQKEELGRLHELVDHLNAEKGILEARTSGGSPLGRSPRIDLHSGPPGTPPPPLNTMSPLGEEVLLGQIKKHKESMLSLQPECAGAAESAARPREGQGGDKGEFVRRVAEMMYQSLESKAQSDVKDAEDLGTDHHT